jgi:DNA polymerase-3 subunit epsilon
MTWWRRTPLAQVRWIVIDCETSGLDAARDRLLSVGAVAMTGARIELAQSMHALVRQASPSASLNILVHGIGGDAQLAGRSAEEVLRELQILAGDAVPVGFHAPFDARILRRYGFRPRAAWIDLAELAPALFVERRGPDTLEHWLAEFGIDPLARHDALADAFATAQVLLVTLAEAERQHIGSLEALRAVERGRRWLRS